MILRKNIDSTNPVSTIAQISDIIDLGHFEHILSSFISVVQDKG